MTISVYFKGRPTHWLNATLATNKNLKLHATQYWKKRPKSAVGGQPRLHHQHAVVPAQLLSEAQVRNENRRKYPETQSNFTNETLYFIFRAVPSNDISYYQLV